MACGDGSFLLAVSDGTYYEFFHWISNCFETVNVFYNRTSLNILQIASQNRTFKGPENRYYLADSIVIPHF